MSGGPRPSSARAPGRRGAVAWGPLALAAALGGPLLSAPMQCSSEADPTQRREDTPAESLLLLAREFEAAGDRAGRIRTLVFLVERHPRSREAKEAYVTLRELGVEVADPSEREGAAPRATTAPPTPDAAVTTSGAEEPAP